MSGAPAGCVCSWWCGIPACLLDVACWRVWFWHASLEISGLVATLCMCHSRGGLHTQVSTLLGVLCSCHTYCQRTALHRADDLVSTYGPLVPPAAAGVSRCGTPRMSPTCCGAASTPTTSTPCYPKTYPATASVNRAAPAAAASWVVLRAIARACRALCTALSALTVGRGVSLG